MASPPRVRYAPSPTGVPHVGNIRTALFNWLFARHFGGSFIVRIEDTDQARVVEGATEAILDSLRWLGLDWDEGPTGQGSDSRGEFGPYFQSARRKLYAEFAQRLVDDRNAYRCWCSTARLAELRNAQQQRKEPPGYDRHCRDLTSDKIRANERSGDPGVVRFAIPAEGSTSFNDMVRGDITFENAVLDDFVVLKSDGFPTYHLANVVDDHLMEISHVMRADEWVSSTPKHVMLYDALGWDYPNFAHLPLILGPDRSKLSKRHGATSVTDHRDEGFLPEALLNFLALLGWSLDDKTEMFTRGELIRHFSIERIGKTGAIFNRQKLEWMNGVYIRALAPSDLARRMGPFLEASEAIPKPVHGGYLEHIAPLVQDRLKVLTESAGLIDFFFMDTVQHDPGQLVGKGMDQPGTLKALDRVHLALEPLASFDATALEGTLRPMAEPLVLKTGQLFGAVRAAVTGRTVAPPLFETMVVLGKERCLQRIAAATETLRIAPAAQRSPT